MPVPAPLLVKMSANERLLDSVTVAPLPDALHMLTAGRGAGLGDGDALREMEMDVEVLCASAQLVKRAAMLNLIMRKNALQDPLLQEVQVSRRRRPPALLM